MNTEKKICVCQCGHTHNVNGRVISMYRGLVSALWEVLRWCESKGIHEFEMRDIRHLFDRIAYTRFGDWVLFGGLVYKHGKAHYGLNLERCRAFFAGTGTIPINVTKNPITGVVTQGAPVYIGEIPSLHKFLDEHRQFIAEYREPVRQVSML